MRKFISLLLIAALAASLLSACAAETFKDVPVKDLMSAVAAGTDLATKMTGQTAAQIQANFYVDPAKCSEYDLKISTNPVSANTLAIFKLADAKDAEAFKTGLQKRLDDQVKVFESYAPAESALSKEGVILVKGSYVLFVVSKDAETVRAAFLAQIKK
jgi:hypothetical protein